MGRGRKRIDVSREQIETALASGAVCMKHAANTIGVNYETFKRRCKEFGLDFRPNPHYLRGTSPTNLPLNELISTRAIKKALVIRGLLEEKCSECGQLPFFNNKPLTLQLDHIDGNGRNNVESNLRLLCPNCHTQTPTWGRKKRN